MAKFILTTTKELNFRSCQRRDIVKKQSFKTYEKAYEAMKKSVEEEMEIEEFMIKTTRPNEKHEEWEYEINEFNAKVVTLQGKSNIIYEIEEID